MFETLRFDCLCALLGDIDLACTFTAVRCTQFLTAGVMATQDRLISAFGNASSAAGDTRMYAAKNNEITVRSL